MKRTKLLLGTMILGLGMAGTAWAQPAPNHDRDARMYGGYSTDRDDVFRARGDQDGRNAVWRGDGSAASKGGYNAYEHKRSEGDGDRDGNHGVWNARGNGDDGNVWRGDRDARSSWSWGHSDMRRGKRDER